MLPGWIQNVSRMDSKQCDVNLLCFVGLLTYICTFVTIYKIYSFMQDDMLVINIQLID